MIDEKIKIICVLRSGGDYTPEYVQNMKKSLDRVIGYRDDWTFTCFTDLDFFSCPDTEIIPIHKRLEGWWSKLEIFRLTGPCLYFDLDTVFLSDFSHLFKTILELKSFEFLALQPFRSAEIWASGIMVWNGDWHQLFSKFRNPDLIVQWDQRYIFPKLEELGATIRAIQGYLTGVYSYKHHCREQVPEDAKIVCFHGRPRPHQVAWINWVKKCWSNI